jgi:hypothetical protein
MLNNELRIYYAIAGSVRLVLAIMCVVLSYFGKKELSNKFREAYFDMLSETYLIT